MPRLYSILKLLTLSTFLWLLFFLNILLPKALGELTFDPVIWNALYLILLVCALIASLVLVAESFRKKTKV